MSARFSDEELMAFADGEADAALSDDIRKAAAKDPKLAKRIDLFKGTAAMAKDAFGDVGKWQPPQELVDKIKSATTPADNIVAFKPRAANNNRPSFFVPSAVAASVALAAGIGIGVFLGGPSADQPTSTIALGPVTNTEVAAALASLKSGEERGLEIGRVQMIATFTDGANRLCREFELDSVSKQTFVTVSCQTGKTWDVVFTAAAPAAQDGYAPAGSRDAVDAYLQSIGASETLSLEQEAERLKP